MTTPPLRSRNFLAMLVILALLGVLVYLMNTRPGRDPDPIANLAAAPAPDPIYAPGNTAIRRAAQEHFRSMDPIMVGSWPRPDEFWIAVSDRNVDWQQRADGACAWIRAQGMQGRFSVWVVEMAALNNKRVEQLAYARCAKSQ